MWWRNMPWMTEDLSGTIDGSNRNFTITQSPVAGSLMVIQQGIVLEAVGSQPQAMQLAYVQTSTSVELGLAPLVGQQRPWARYYY
jgi:hypothetical protein